MDAYAGRLLIGTACAPGNYSEAVQANIKAHYNVITPENRMKSGPIHPAEDRYNFGPPENIPRRPTFANIKTPRIVLDICLRDNTLQ